MAALLISKNAGMENASVLQLHALSIIYVLLIDPFDVEMDHASPLLLNVLLLLSSVLLHRSAVLITAVLIVGLSVHLLVAAL